MIVFGSKYMKKHSHYHDPGVIAGKVTAAVLDSDATFSNRSSKISPDWQRQRLLMKSIAVSKSSSVMTGSGGGAAGWMPCKRAVSPASPAPDA